MHSHEAQPVGFQPQVGSPKPNPFGPRPFEVTFPGQEVASSATNPFAQRSHETWTAEPGSSPSANTTLEQQPQAESPSLELNWNRINLYSEGQPPPEQPWWRNAQAKLTIGQRNDPYEQEADRVAAQVMSMPEPTAPIQRQVEEAEGSEAEREEIQTKPLSATITPLVQRQTDATIPEADEETTEIQTKPGGTADRSASPTLEQQLAQQQGKGSPLPNEVQSFMEPRFGADFSQVRVHTGSEAVQMNKEVGAQAFAHKDNIYFGAGKSPGNHELMAHELTHVIQQTGTKQLKLQRKEKQNKSFGSGKEYYQSVDAISNQSTKDQANSFETQFAKSSQPSPIPEAFSPFQNTAQQIANSVPQISDRASKPAQIEPEKSLIAHPLEGPTGIPSTQKTQQGTSSLQQATTQSSGHSAAQNQTSPGNQLEGVANNLKAEADSVSGGNTTLASNSGVGGSSGAGAPAVDVGGGAEAEAEPAVADDPELEAIATNTEGVELASNDHAEAQAGLATIAEAGGGASEIPAGGGGSGAAIPDQAALPTPNVSQAEPVQALATVSQLPPAQLLAGLTGVSAAIDSSVNKQRAELAANPPTLQRPSSSPIMKGDAGGDRAPSGDKAPKPVEKAPEGAAKTVAPPKPVTLPPPPPIVATPSAVKGDSEGKLSAGDVQALQASVRQMPTRDPGLNVKAEAPPPLHLQGNSDPKQAQEQKAKLDKSLAENQAQGQQELAQPMGEQDIYPKVPQETLTAEVTGGAGGSGGAIATPMGAGAAGQGAAGDDAISVIAQQEHGQQIQAAVAQAQSQMAAQKQSHVVKVAEEKERSNKEISQLQANNTNEQAQERAKAQSEVAQQRADWNKEQTDLIGKSRQNADSKVAQGMQDIQQEQTQAETKATEHIEKGNQDAEAARLKGEEEAAAEKRKGEQESGGVFGWLADKAKAFFDGIKQAIQKAFEIARAAVKAAIDVAKKLATEVIEAARKTIVAVIKTVGDALIAIGDTLLAAFPEMRDRFRNAIKSVVQKAEATVNALAEKLKQGVQAALNLLGKGLDAALGLLKKGYLMAVDIASKAVQGAISAAKAAVDALGAFAALAKDIASGPAQWISNMAAGVMDGIRNHLWAAFQVAVKGWFNQKIEEVLGLGITIWNVLSKGGIKLEEVGTMAWEGIKSAIPPALIQILIEKLVSMIVPAAGTVMLIIEGIQAAWGTASRILQAMERFMGFLKAVKSGQSGPQFGQLLAAAGVILIDFVANWLLKRVRGAASKVANKVKEIAKKIGNKLKKAMKKIGKKLRGGMKKLSNKARKLKEKLLGGKGKKSEKDKQKKQEDHEKLKRERLNRAIQEVKPSVDSMLQRGVPTMLLKARLAMWRIHYRIRRLELGGTSNRGRVEAANSPTVVTNDFFRANRDEIFRMIVGIARDRHKQTRTGDLGSRSAEGGPIKHQPGRNPDELGEQLAKRHKGEVVDVEVGGERFAARVQHPRSNVILGERQGEAGTSVKGRAYYEIANRSRESSEQLAEQVFQTFSTGKAPSREAAELGAVLFGPEVARSPLFGVTGRLGLLGMREKRLSSREALGTVEAHKREREVRNQTRDAVKRLIEEGQQREAKRQKLEGNKDARHAGRESGGLIPQSMRRAVPTERVSEKGVRDINRSKERHLDIEELKNRTVELVHKVVANKEYQDLAALRQDIIKKLEEADRLLGVKET